MVAKAAPPVTNRGPARSAQKYPCAGTWVAHRIPAPTRIVPITMTSLAEARVTSICAGPASTSAVDSARRRYDPLRPHGADAGPDAERLVALGAIAEHVHHDGQRGR